MQIRLQRFLGLYFFARIMKYMETRYTFNAGDIRQQKRYLNTRLGIKKHCNGVYRGIPIHSITNVQNITTRLSTANVPVIIIFCFCLIGLFWSFRISQGNTLELQWNLQ